MNKRSPWNISNLRFTHAIGAACLAVLAMTGSPAAAGDIKVTDAVAQLANDSSNGHRIEIYMEISNSGGKDRLYSVRSDLSRETMLSMGGAMQASMDGHSHMGHGADSRHHQTAALEVRPDEVAVLRKGGAHIMLNNPDRLPAAGATFPITLFFEGAGRVTVDVTMNSTDLASQPVQ